MFAFKEMNFIKIFSAVMCCIHAEYTIYNTLVLLLTAFFIMILQFYIIQQTQF